MNKARIIERTNNAEQNSLCGSAMAHHNCKYAGGITSQAHICNASGAKYERCEYADKGGLIHREYGIKVDR